MNIRNQERIGVIAALATIGLVAGNLWWQWQEVGAAMQERSHATVIQRSLMEIRLVTFEYLLDRSERARVQWNLLADRLDRLLADDRFRGGPRSDMLSGMRGRQAAAREAFATLAELTRGADADADPGAETAATVRQHFEQQTLNRLVMSQQNNVYAAFDMTDLSSRRIAAAQRNVLLWFTIGMLVLAGVIVAASWRLHRAVLDPLLGIQAATNSVASGNLGVSLRIDRRNEIGALARDFNAMTAALRDSYRRIEASNQELALTNRELESFSYSVSHDLRAPLRQIDGFSEILVGDLGPKLDDENRRVLGIIRDSTRRMGRLIDDLLAFSRLGRRELVFSPVDMAELAQACFVELRDSAAGAERRLELQALPQAAGDAAMLRQVWLNLLSNALKFSATRPETPITVGGRADRDALVYLVRDQGVGFDPKYADKLFNVFQRLHAEEAYEGTGIGLALVKRIVERHGGRVWAEGEEGRGATFCFSLPREVSDDRSA